MNTVRTTQAHKRTLHGDDTASTQNRKTSSMTQTTRFRFARPLITAAVIASLAACASTPLPNAALEQAHTSYSRAASDPNLARTAPVELDKAKTALAQADAAYKAGDDQKSVDYYAGLAQKRVEVADAAGAVAMANDATTAASAQRNEIVLASRSREAQQLRDQAATAQTLADQQVADALRMRAELSALKAKQTERGMVLTLGDVLFDTGKARLKPGAGRTIDQLANFMKKNPNRSVEIDGYTDSTGSEQTNQALSAERAQSVEQALVDRSISADRISTHGMGEASPVASNDTAAGRQQNRRVEIVISGTAAAASS